MNFQLSILASIPTFARLKYLYLGLLHSSSMWLFFEIDSHSIEKSYISSNQIFSKFKFWERLAEALKFF
jgi:hypothetical protein